MKLVLVAALVTVLAFAGSRFSFLRLPLARLREPLGVRNLLLTGTEYLLVGLGLGPYGLGVLDAQTLDSLAPVLGLGLAWIGMLFGLQWEVRRLDPATRAGLGPALVQAGIAAVVVAVPFYALLRPRFEAPEELVLGAALALGAAASDTAQSALGLVGRAARAADRILARWLRLVADVDGLVALAVFGAVCWLPALHGGQGAVGLWAALSVGLGVAVGLVVVGLVAVRLEEDEHLLVLLGSVLVGGGLALHLSLSPLLVNAIAGAVVANLARERARRALRSLLLHGDRAVYVLFLILVGAGWHPGGWSVLGLAGLYLGLRTAGKLVGARVAVRGTGGGAPAHLGLGLLSHGGLAVAVVANLHILLPDAPLTDAVTSIVLLGVVVSELVSPTLVHRLLTRPRTTAPSPPPGGSSA